MSEFNIELYNNKSTPVASIPNEWVKNYEITYKYMDIDEFGLSIPRKLDNGSINPIYKMVKSGQQLLVNKEDGTQDRFYITSKKSTNGRKSFENKEFTAYQFQKKLEGIFVTIPQSTYQLSNKVDPTYSADGLFDLIEENCNYSFIIDDKECAYSNEEVDEVLDYTFNISKISDVKIDGLIFDKTVNFKVRQTDNGSMPLYINIIYQDVKVNSSDEGLQDYGTVYNDFDVPFYGNVKRITCKYCDEAGNRNSLKYTFYYENGDSEEIIKPFVNALGKELTFGNENIIKHTTGNKVKNNIIKMINYEECNCSVSELLDDISDKYDVVYDFDNINMIIHVFGKEKYGKTMPLELSLDSNCLEVTTSENEDSLLITSMLVSGQTVNDKQVSISGQNIFGGDTIYNYDYYINNGLLSDNTVNAWNKYKRQLEINQDRWYELKDNANQVNDILITTEAEIQSLNKKVSYTSNILSTYMVDENSDKDAQERISKELKEYQDRLASCLSQREILKDKYETIYSEMETWSDNNKRESIKDNNGNKIFDENSLNELKEIDKCEAYEDNYFVTNYSLYNYCVEKLSEKVYPTIDFNITSSNCKKYMEITNGLFVLGNKHDLDEELSELLEVKEVRLTEKVYNIKNKEYTKFSFSNAYKKTDLLSKISSLGRKSNRTSQTLSDYTKVVSDASLSGNFVKSMYAEGLNLLNSKINGRTTVNKIDINASGIWIVDSENEDCQLYIGSSCLGITQDRWESCKLGITPQGSVLEEKEEIIIKDVDLFI